ncbi:MAG TPA: ankyrin repeat domain-containing protein [Pyrinomonadaceae bacterium]
MFIFLIILSVIVLAIIVLIVLAKLEAFEAVPLLKAIKRNRTEEALALLKQGADINLKNKLQETPLICAAYAGNIAVAKVLVESGAEVNAQSIPARYSALLWAALNGHAEIVRLLIKAGADVNVQDWEANTPLMRAAQSGHREVVEDLIAAGADKNARNKEGKTALTIAILFKRVDVARTLIKAGAEVNRIDNRGASALQWLLNTQQYDTAEALFDDMVSAGLEINGKDSGDVTQLMSAVSVAVREKAKGSHPLLNIIRKLVGAGADVSAALGIAQMHKADAQRADPMGLFDKHIKDVIDILTSR